MDLIVVLHLAVEFPVRLRSLRRLPSSLKSTTAIYPRRYSAGGLTMRMALAIAQIAVAVFGLVVALMTGK